MLKENKNNLIHKEERKVNELHRLGPAYAVSINENSRFWGNTDEYVTITERFNDGFRSKEYVKNNVEKIKLEWIRRFGKRFPTFKDLKEWLPECIWLSIKDQRILKTHQRSVNWNHVFKILSQFDTPMLMPLHVVKYHPTEKKNCVVFDGQHTALVIYLISIAMGWSLDEIEVPVNIHRMEKEDGTPDLAKMRDVFLKINGDAKLPMDAETKFEQHIYAVRFDNSTDENYVLSEKTFQHLEKAGIFVTNSKSGLSNCPGAYTLLAETIFNGKLDSRNDPEITRAFCYYFTKITESGEPRPVEAKEARIMFKYLEACFIDGIKLTDEYLDKLIALFEKLFQADLSPNSIFWTKAIDSYMNAMKDNSSTSKIRKPQKEWQLAGPFMIAQINKSLPELATPKYEGSFIPNSTDLF